MTPLDIAREKVLAAALAYASGRIGRECSSPGPWDDASAELDSDVLDHAIDEYVAARPAA